jgi:hypothetical protein
VGGIASKLGLLTPKQKEEVKERLQAFRRANPQVRRKSSTNHDLHAVVLCP